MLISNTPRIWFVGLSGSGKTTASNHLNRCLTSANLFTLIIDGDDVRDHVSTDLGFEFQDRQKQVIRISGISYIIIKQELSTICSSVYMDEKLAKSINEQCPTLFVHVSRPMDILEATHPTYKETSNIVGKDISPNYNLDNVLKLTNNGNLDSFLLQVETLAEKIIREI